MPLNLNSSALIFIGVFILGMIYGLISGILIAGFKTNKYISALIGFILTLLLHLLLFGTKFSSENQANQSLILYGLTSFGSSIAAFITCYIFQNSDKTDS